MLPPLTPVGRKSRKDEIVRGLKNQLYLQDTIKKDPSILEEKIVRPWIILGLPRTGSTLLQRLLATDMNHRSPLCWEIYCYFPIPKNEKSRRRRIEKTKLDLKLIDFANPEFRAIHEMGAELPEECIGLLANGLVTRAWGDFSDEARLWLEASDMTKSYQLHKKQLLIWQKDTPGKTWILKSPIHLLFLKHLLKVYPDACIIQTHRDPVEVLPSTASLVTAISRLKYDKIDPHEIGAMVFRDMKHMLAEGARARQDALANPDYSCRFVDVTYSELKQNPMGTVSRIYAELGADLSQEAHDRMKAFLNENRQHKWGRHAYQLDYFGLETSRVRQEFAQYIEEKLAFKH